MKLQRVLIAAIAIALAWAAPGTAQSPVNVLQDCWTNQQGDFDLEPEGYLFPAGSPVHFIWKHKLMLPCSSYIARIVGQQCRSGKPKPAGPPPFEFTVRFGNIEPDPAVPERLFDFVPPPGSLPPGTWDWFLLTECADTTGAIPVKPDGDIDDECGINVGKPPIVPFGPVMFGPEPVEIGDPDPGGFPPGRMAGEEGTTRPWCFTVE